MNPRTCPSCGGDGREKRPQMSVRMCVRCAGTGKLGQVKPNAARVDSSGKRLRTFTERNGRIVERRTAHTKRGCKNSRVMREISMKTKHDNAAVKLAADYIVSESAHGNFRYHISHRNTFTRGLCGAETMQTLIPFSAWGVRTHLRETYCRDCERSGKIKKLLP